VIERWLEALVATPGLTSLRGDEARRVLVEDSLRAVEVMQGFDGPIVDVGSGGGAPGIPLAVELPEREVTLLESSRRKCDFLERWARELPNVRVVCGRAEEQPVDAWGVAVAKALASPPSTSCVDSTARSSMSAPAAVLPGFRSPWPFRTGR